jgi:localization factor PodJL
VKAKRQSLNEGAEPRTIAAGTPAPDNARTTEATATALWSVPDYTAALPRAATPQSPAPAQPAGSFGDKLPASIGGPALRAAALAGDPAAAYEIASRFAEGRGVAQNAEEAARWFDRAAKAGLAPAEFRLGSLYEKGVGVKKDLARARDLYRAAADKGHGKAMHNLAVLYAEGVDGAADYREAAQWFRKAADRGLTDSQYNLGILYARGIGVERNFAESYKWFALAAKQGDNDAGKKRDEVATHPDQESLAAARLAVENWSAEPQPADAISVKVPPAWGDAANRAGAAKSKPRTSGKDQGADAKVN